MLVDPVDVLHRAVVRQSHLQVSVVEVGVQQSEPVELVADVGVRFVKDSVYVDLRVFSRVVVGGLREQDESLELLLWQVLLSDGIVDYI